MKSCQTYFDTNEVNWQQIETGLLSGHLSCLTLAEDPDTGDYTRLTKFSAGCRSAEVQAHNYPEEVYIVSGRVYDEAFDLWLEKGYYASRPAFERHGPFYAEKETIVLEISYPSQAVSPPA